MNNDYKAEYLFTSNTILKTNDPSHESSNYDVSKTGCLLIHGITGTPAELRQLGVHLHKAGFTVKGVLLKGHGTKVGDMMDCTYEDWISSAYQGYHELKDHCNEIFVIGHSMGSLISLYLATQVPIDGVVALSPPFVLKKKTSHFAFLAKYFMNYASWPEREFDETMKPYIIGYPAIPIKSIDELNKLRRKVKQKLHEVNSPLLVVHSKKDGVVHDKSVDFLLKKVPSLIKQICILETSGHLITVEEEREKVFSEVTNFLVNTLRS